MRYVPKEDQRYIHYYMKVARETRGRALQGLSRLLLLRVCVWLYCVRVLAVFVLRMLCASGVC